MNHVQQKHPKGCVVACLSMLTGIPYDDILSDFAGDRLKDGLSQFTYDVWLNQRGYTVLRLYKHWSPLHADKNRWPCAPFAEQHLCTVRIGDNSHAVVMTGDGTILDPLKDAAGGALADYAEVNYVAGIYRVRDPLPPEILIGLHWSDGNRRCQWCGAPSDSYQYHDPCPARSGLMTP